MTARFARHDSVRASRAPGSDAARAGSDAVADPSATVAHAGPNVRGLLRIHKPTADRMNLLRATRATRSDPAGRSCSENAGSNRPFGLRMISQAWRPRPAGHRQRTNQDLTCAICGRRTIRFPWLHAVRLDFGKFWRRASEVETNYAKDNNNFSRAYLFNFLPF